MDLNRLDEVSYVVTAERFRELNHDIQEKSSIDQIKGMVSDWCHINSSVEIQSLLGPLNEQIQRISKRLGKKVHFELVGGETLVSQELVNPVVQNLIHLVRNSVDHGIESPWDRGKKGQVGLISLRFSIDEENGLLSIEFEDDGRGLDVRQLISKAKKLGIVDDETLADQSVQSIYQLAFHEGLSTRKKVSSISGHGLGLPAIKSAVESIGGNLKLETQMGEVTEITLQVPAEDKISS